MNYRRSESRSVRDGTAPGHLRRPVGLGFPLMQEFLGLAYFSEVPIVLFDIQRAGPSTGMPTRTQQSDLFSCAYASHGDSKQVLLFPKDPRECFDFAADAFDIADRLQTPVIVMTDLELGMNEHLCDPLSWDDNREYDRGKILSAEQLEEIEKFGRYLDVDGDGIPYRTLPGTHQDLGSYFTRGSSHDEFAAYTEDGDVYAGVMDRIAKKFANAHRYLPQPVTVKAEGSTASSVKLGMIYFGSTSGAIKETLDALDKQGLHLSTMRIRSFPFHTEVESFIDSNDFIFVIEQNRDAQMKSLLKIECGAHDEKLISIRSYNGVLITAQQIEREVLDAVAAMQQDTPSQIGTSLNPAK